MEHGDPLATRVVFSNLNGTASGDRVFRKKGQEGAKKVVGRYVFVVLVLVISRNERCAQDYCYYLY